MNRTDLGRRIAALAGAAAAVTAAGGLLPAVAHAATGEVTVTTDAGNVTYKISKPEGYDRCIGVGIDNPSNPTEVAIKNETEKPLKFYSNSVDCGKTSKFGSVDAQNLKPGATAKDDSVQYGFSFVVPQYEDS
ncbi:hypothetical protein ACFYO1_13265 [Nocardia sp. NPDC006044]|uniref:hypothetical protein n=1 Tax=Nocardia sp. NPDC006044 TaxID=3364306 RepID=UPI0036A34B6B